MTCKLVAELRTISNVYCLKSNVLIWGFHLGMFFQNMAVAAQQVVILYILVAAGFIADRLNIFTDKIAKSITSLLFFMVTPSVIIRSFMTMEFTKENALGLLTAFLCILGTFAIAIVISLPFFRKKDNRDNPVYKFASIYGNMGYMGLPLAEAVLGPQGAFYCSSGIIAYNMFSFTHGIWLMTKDNEGKNKFRLRQLFMNPGVISVCIGLPFFLFSINMPAIITQPINYMANLNTPIAMLILGSYISHTDLKSVFKQKEHYQVILIKLLVLPFIMSLIYRFIGLNGVLLTAVTISSSTPSANNTVIFAARFEKDPATASKVVAFVSFASILTMPFFIALAQTI